MSDPGPYRDDRDSLLAENRRLRRQLAVHPRVRAWPALAALAVYAVALVTLADWLHAGSALRYWVAVAILIGSLVAAAGFGLRILRGNRRRGDDDGNDSSV